MAIAMYKSIILLLPHNDIASNRDINSIAVLKNIEGALRELEDTTRASFDFVTQIILNVLLTKLAMVTTNLHRRSDFDR